MFVLKVIYSTDSPFSNIGSFKEKRYYSPPLSNPSHQDLLPLQLKLYTFFSFSKNYLFIISAFYVIFTICQNK